MTGRRRKFRALLGLALGSILTTAVDGQPQRVLHGRVFWITEDGERSAAAGVRLSVRTGAADELSPTPARAGPDGKASACWRRRSPTCGRRRACVCARGPIIYGLAFEHAAAAGASFAPAAARAGLAETRWLQGRRQEGVDLLRRVVTEDPEYRSAHLLLHVWAQEELYDFELALRTLSGWLDGHPQDLAAIILLPKTLFTNARFENCAELVLALRDDPRIGPLDEIVLRVYEIAAWWVLGREVSPLLRQLGQRVAELPEEVSFDGNFGGTVHFLRHHPAVGARRPLLLELFALLRAGGRGAIVDGLNKLADASDSLHASHGGPPASSRRARYSSAWSGLPHAR